MPDYTTNITFVVSRKGDGFAQMEADIKNIRQSVEQMNNTTVKGNQANQSSLQQAGLKWTELKSKIDLAVGALKTVYQAGKQFFNLLQEGAALEETERKFGRLAESIGTTSDALKTDLSIATGGLLTSAEQMAAATDFMSLGLAKTSDEAVRLSNVSSQLGMNMNQLVLTLTNQTTMRFDALGLAVDGFDEKVQRLRETGLSANDAFKEAFLQQAEEQLERVGSVVDTNAGKLQILAANWQESTDNMKRGILDAAAPVIDSLADMVTAANNAELAIIKLGDAGASLDDLKAAVTEVKAAINEVGATGSPFAPVQTVRTRDALKELAAQISLTTTSVEEQRAKLESYGFTVDDIGVKLNGMGVSWIEINKIIDQLNYQKAYQDTLALNDGFYALGLTFEKTEEQIASLRDEEGNWRDDVSKSIDAAYEAEGAFLDLGYGSDRLAGHFIDLQLSEQDTTDTTDELAEAMKRAAAASGDFFTEAMNAEAGAGLYETALSDLGEKTYYVSNLTQDQKGTLSALQDQYDKAAGAVRDYQTGVKGILLTDDERNEKIQEQLDLMDALAPKIDELNAVGGDYVTVNNEATFNQDALNSALYDAVDAAGGSAEQLAELGVKTGMFSEEAATAALKSAAMREKIAELGDKIAEGMGIDEALDLLDQFQERLDRRYEVSVDVQDALRKLSELQNSADVLAEKLGGIGGPTASPSSSPPPSGSNTPYDPGSSPTGGNRFFTGGYTGVSGGVVDPHEFVFSRQATSNIGVGNLTTAHEMAKRGIPDALSYAFGPHGTASGMSGGSTAAGVVDNSVIIESINITPLPGMDEEALADHTVRKLGAMLKSRINSGALGARF